MDELPLEYAERLLIFVNREHDWKCHLDYPRFPVISGLSG